MPALWIRSLLRFQRKMWISGLLSTRNLLCKKDCPTNHVRFETAMNPVSIFKAKLGKVWDCQRQKLYHTGLAWYKKHITVLLCFNAAGQFIPPFILFSGKHTPVGYNVLEGAAPGSAFAVTEKGYMDATTFYLWHFQSFHSPFASCKASCPFS